MDIHEIIMNLKVNADYSQAIESTQTFNEEVDKTTHKAEDIGKVLDYITSKENKDYYQSLFGDKYDSLLEMKTVLSGINDEMATLKQGFSGKLIDDNFVKVGEQRLRSLGRALHSLGTEAANLYERKSSKDTPWWMLSSAQNADIARRDLQDIRSLFGFKRESPTSNRIISSGLSVYDILKPQQITTLLKSQGYANREIRGINAISKGILNINELSGLLAQRPMFEGALSEAAPGQNFSEAQKREIAKMLVLRSHNYSNSNVGAAAEALKLKNSVSPNFVLETIPAGLREAYSSYGSNGKAKELDLGAAVEKAAMDQFVKLVIKGNRAAIETGLKSNILQMDRGKFVFGKATLEHWSKLAGETAKYIRDAQSGVPYLWADITDPNDQERILRRQSKKYQDAEKLSEIIDLQKGYVADAALKPSFVEDRRKTYKRVKMTKGWYPNQYIIPQTVLDPETLQPIYRDPNLQLELEKGKTIFDKTADMPFVTMGSNAITQLLGYKGNNTGGYGRNEKGEPIRPAKPLIFELNMTPAIGENEDREYVVTNEKLKNAHVDIGNRTKQAEYGGTNYIAAWSGGDTQNMMQADVYELLTGRGKIQSRKKNPNPETNADLKTWQERLAPLNLPEEMFNTIYDNAAYIRRNGLGHLFDNFFAGELLPGSTKAQNQFIDYGKKKATPSFSMRELGFKKSPKLTLADFSAIYDLFGVPETDSFMRIQERIDGPIYVMPQFAPSGFGFQNRAAFGGVKSMAIPEDFKYIMQQGGVLEKIYETGKYDYLFRQKDNTKAKKALKEKYNEAQNTVDKLQSEYDDISDQIVSAGDNVSEDLLKKQKSKKRSLKRAKKWLAKQETAYNDAPDTLYDFYVPMVGLEKEVDSKGDETGDLYIQDAQGNKVTLFKHLQEQQEILKTSKSQKKRNAAAKEIERVQDTYMKNVVGEKVEAVVTDTAAKIKYNKMDLEDYYQMFGNPNIPYANETLEKKARREARLRDLNLRTNNGVVSLTAKEQDIFANKANEIVGMQVNKITPDFEGIKDYIPASMAIAIGATQKMIDLSHENYNKAKEALNSEEGQRAFLETLPRGRQILKEHIADWQEQDEAKRLIANQLQKLEQDEQEGHLLFPGQNGMAASGPKPGSAAVGLLSGLGINVHDLKESSIKDLFVSANDVTSIVAASPLFRNWETVSASRHPAAPGEYVPNIRNEALSPTFIQKLRSVGADTKFAYLNPRQQYQMNSGDFDGDTTWIFQDITGDLFSEMEYVRNKMFDARQYMKDNNMVTKSNKFSAPAKSMGEAQIQFLLNHLNAQNEMALYSSGIRNAMTGWRDDDEKWLALAMNVDAYDKATSERMKQGLKTSISGVGDRAAKEGATFSRLIKQLNGLKNDEEDAYVNLFGAKAPSINDDQNLKHIIGTFISRQAGELPNQYLADELDYWVGKNYDENTLRGKAAKTYADVLKNYFTGRKVANDDDIISLYSAMNLWQADIDRRKKAGDDSKALKDETSELRSLRARIKYLKENGLTEENISSRIATLNTELTKYRGWENALKETPNAISADAYVDIFGQAAFATAKKSTKEGEEDLYTLSDNQAKVFKTMVGEKIAGRSGSIKALKNLISPKDRYLEFLDILSDTKDAEQKAAIEEIRGRILSSSENEPITPSTVGELKKYLHAETVSTRTKMNWSDITPWMYDAMKDSGFYLEGISRESLMPKGHRLNTEYGTQDTILPNKAIFDPYPYGGDKTEQKNIIMARELDQGHKFVQPFEMNEAIYGGKLRHQAFEMYFKAKALKSANLSPETLKMMNEAVDEEGNVDQDFSEVLGVTELANLTPGELLARMITSRKSVQQLAEFGLGVRRKADGQIDLAIGDNATNVNAVSNLKESIENALGDFVDGKYQGGTLNAIADKILSDGSTVVNIEGLNIENGEMLNPGELYGRGVKYNFGPLKTPLSELAKPEDQRDKNVKKEDIHGTFAPDLITRGKNGLYTMHDYKTGEAGAIDSLYQQYVYITNTLNKAKEEIMGNKNNGWARFLSEDVRNKALEMQKQGTLTEGAWEELIAKSSNPLLFEKIRAYDTKFGGMLTLGYSEDIRKKIWDYSEQGRILKQQEAENGYEEGINYIRSLLTERYGKDYEKKGGRTVQSALASRGSKSGYIDFLSHKFGEDQDKIDEISSKLYREGLKQDKISGGGYNRFDAMRKELDETLPPDLLNAINKKLTDAKDEVGLQVLAGVTAKKERAQSELEKVERYAAVEDWDNLKTSMRKTFFGVEADSSLSAIFDTISQSNSVRKIRESWINNPELYNKKTGQWTAKGKEELKDMLGERMPGTSYAEMYAKAEEEEAKFMKEFRESLPVLTENSVRSNDQRLRGLLRDNTKFNAVADLQDAYQKRIDALAKYVREQDATIAKATEELAQKVSSAADAAYTITGPERESIKTIKANAEKNRREAASALTDKDVKRTVLNERMRELGLKPESIREKTQRWVNERLAALDESDKTPDNKHIREAEEKEALAKKEYDEVANAGNARISEFHSRRNAWLEAHAQTEQAKTAQLEENARLRETVIKEGKILEQRDNTAMQARIDEFDRLTSGRSATKEQRVAARLQAAQDHALDQALNAPSAEEKKMWEERLFNDTYWNDYKKRLENEETAKKEESDLYRRQKLDDITHQTQVASERRQHALQNQYRNMVHPTRSRIVQAIRQQQELVYGYNRDYAEAERLQLQTQERQALQVKSFKETYGISYNDYQKLTDEEKEKRGLGENAQKDASNIATTAANIKKYGAAMNDASAAAERLSGPMPVLSAGFQRVGSSVSMLLRRFGRQLFQKALNEAKKFVLEFNQTMTSIQMITLKTDEQMSTLGDGLIAKAKELKVSISEITQAAATLYRQGLSDEEVEQRLEVISKFSKVSGTKVDAATKLITVAMNTGLVTDPQMAADIVTALGDNAATNAAEIEKGIEKAGAAAAADGTTFAQLASMLTAITSTTQIGGNVAGRTLNTIFGRMNKIGTNELIYDENGHAISGSAVAQLLAKQGINQYDANGNKLSSYDVLYALSQRWESMSDAEQQQIANAIAGTRQYSNFAAIMQGMAEGKVSEYMDLAGNASGITDQKYDVYLKSLQASLTDLKNAFDELIADITESGTLQGILDFVKTVIKGIDNITKSIGSLGTVLFAILPTVTGLMMAMEAFKLGNWKIGLLGLGISATGLGISALSGAFKDTATASDRLSANKSAYSSTVLERFGNLDRLTELRNKSSRSSAENEEFAKLIHSYAYSLGLINSPMDQAKYSIDNLIESIKNLSSAADDTADEVIRQATEEEDREWAWFITQNKTDIAGAITESIREKEESAGPSLSLSNPILQKILFRQDPTTGEVFAFNNFSDVLESWTDAGFRNDSLWGAGRTIRNIGNTALGWLFGNVNTEYSYEKDIKPILLSFFKTAAFAHRFDEFDPDAITRSDEEWSRLFQTPGGITQEHYLAALRYLMQAENSEGETGEYKRVKSSILPQLQEILGDRYSAGLIDYLADKATSKYFSNGHNMDLALAYIWGSDTSDPEKVKAAIEQAREGYAELDTISLIGDAFVTNAGRHGYYIDENGNIFTEAQVREEGEREQAELRTIAIDTMLAYNEKKKASATSAYAAIPEEERVGPSLEDYLASELIGGADALSEDAATLANKLGDLFDAGEVKVDEVADAIDEATQEIRRKGPQFKAVVNRFMTAVDVGYNGTNNSWYQKNQTGLDADYLAGLLLSGKFGSGVEGLNAFMRYVNESGDIRAAEAWNSIGTIGEVARLLTVNTTEGKAGSYATATEGVMDELLHIILNNSLTYKTSGLTTQQKGTIALSAFTDLIAGKVVASQEDLETKQRTAYNEYISQLDEKVAVEHVQEIQAIRESTAIESEEEKEARIKKLIAYYRNQQGALSFENFVVSRPDLKKDVLTLEQQQYLQEALGDDIYSRITGGTASESEKQLAYTMLSNRSLGLTSLTSKQKLEGIALMEKNLASIGTEGGFSSTVAASYLEGWANAPEYLALISAKNTNQDLFEEYGGQEKLDELNASLEVFKKNAEIKMKIEGVQALEDANEVLSGTASLIESIQKNSAIKIKAEVSFSAEQTETLKQIDTLRSDNQDERISAISALTGMSPQDVIRDIDYATRLAKVVAQQTEAQMPETIKQIAEFDQEFAADFAQKHGYHYNADTGEVTSRVDYYNNQIGTGLADEQLIGRAAKEGIIYDKDANRFVIGSRPSSSALSFDESWHLAGYNYNQNNRAALAANNLYTLFASQEKGATKQSVLSLLEDESVKKDWEALLASAPELTSEFAKMGHTVKEDGTIDWDAIEKEAGGLDQALADLAHIIASRSLDFQNAEYDTRSDILTNANAFYETQTVGADNENYNAFATIVGSDMAAKVAASQANNATLTPEEKQYIEWLMNNYENGIIGLTDTQKLQGAQAIFNSLQNGTYQTVFGDANQDMISAFTSAVPGLQELIGAMQDEATSEDEITQRTEEVRSAFIASMYSAQNYGEGIDEVTESLTRLSKGGKTALQEIIRLNKQAFDLQDAMTAWEEAFNGGKVKSGSQISQNAREAIASYTGASVSEIEQWTAEEMAAYFANKTGRATINADMNSVVETAINDAIADIQSVYGDISDFTEPIDIGGTISIICNPDGSINMEGLIALAEAAQSDAIAVLENMEQGKLAEWIAMLKTSGSTEDGTFRAWVEAKTNTKAKGNGSGGYGYNNRGKSSGGGGKSAADTLIENQKHAIAQLEHEQKMLEIDETHYDKVNDYDSYVSTIEKELDLQGRLEAQYARNIAELKDLLSKTEQGSDDYWKLTEALNAAEEAMKNIVNAEDELRAKRITALEQKQEIQTKPLSHYGNLLQKQAQNYQLAENFDKYEATQKNLIDQYRKDIDTNNGQIKEWENLLATMKEGDDNWIQIRDKIWALKETNADYENQILQETIALSDSRLSQIAKELERNQGEAQHNLNNLSTYGKAYQSLNMFDEYRSTLLSTNANNTEMRKYYQTALADAQIAMKQLEKDGLANTEAWYSARSAIYSYDEALHQLDVTDLENKQALGESFVQQAQYNFEQSTKALQAELQMAQLEAEGFKEDNDLLNYQARLGTEADITNSILKEQNDQLTLMKAQLQAAIDAGYIEKGSNEWKTYQEYIWQTEQAVKSTENSLKKLNNELQQTSYQNLVDAFNDIDELNQHQIKLVQYQETKYQNRNELTNYGSALEQDNILQRERAANIQKHLDDLKEVLSNTEQGSTLYDQITSDIYKWEEALESVNNTIEKNDEAIKKNREAIIKAQTDVEDVIDKEIRNRIQIERNMLSAMVSMENTIAAVIKKNYQDRWNLEKKTIEKKKQALNEEKALINERLNARKEAINQEQKMEELAEYQRQLSLISADPTRTKEAAELRRKIAELQRDLSWDVAQQNVQAEIEAIDDQIKAMDDYVSTEEEDLNERLSNYETFREEIDTILSGEFSDFVYWMKQNNEEYNKASAEQREQMEQGWEDTWHTMKHELQTYWDQVDETMRSRQGFLEYMMASDEYLSASVEKQKALELSWGNLYDKYTASKVDDYAFADAHIITTKIDEMKEWTYKVEWADNNFFNALRDYFSLFNGTSTDLSTDIMSGYNLYQGVGRVETPTGTGTGNSGGSSGGSGSGGSGGASTWYYIAQKPGDYGNYREGTLTAYSESDAISQIQKMGLDPIEVSTTKPTSPTNSFVASNTSYAKDIDYSGAWTDKSLINEKLKNRGSSGLTSYTGAVVVKKYASGGLVDYTGPAWVDGSKTMPESFLDATDTALLRDMLDSYSYIKTTPYMTHLDQSNFGKGSVNVGDINVNLYEAKLENDTDYDVIAQKVGKAFTKQLQKDGFNLAAYAW